VAFIRVKTIRGRDYAYLVESRWDAARKTSRQATIKYLGAVDGVRLEDVPAPYRNEGVEHFVLQHSAEADARRARIGEGLAERLAMALLAGDRKAAAELTREGIASLGLEAFYADTVRGAMYRVGDLWKAGEISISQEHLASNVMAQVLDEENAGIRARPRTRGTVAVCTPLGEQHNLATRVLEGLLMNRGYRTFNISASAPTDAIVDFIAARKPDAVFVSLTIPEYLPNAKRLVRALLEKAPKVRLFVGGQAIPEDTDGALPPGSVFPAERTLDALDGLEKGGR
jgi:methanogenic corrinoid protein MtbC1